MAVDSYVQHRDPDGKIPHQEIRSRGRNRVERFAEREKFGRDEPARDAELNDPAFAHSDLGPVELTERERNYGVWRDNLGENGASIRMRRGDRAER